MVVHFPLHLALPVTHQHLITYAGCAWRFLLTVSKIVLFFWGVFLTLACVHQSSPLSAQNNKPSAEKHMQPGTNPIVSQEEGLPRLNPESQHKFVIFYESVNHS